jgi:predicted ribosome quality control (RQC) complex YloA/Tae2 family protein
MQPFDALTMRAVLQEARPLLINRKIEKVYQLGRDEIILAVRMKTGIGHMLLSAQASFGRLCLIAAPALPKAVNPPAFCQLLRKHLTGASLQEIEQVPGERVADLTFACVDELGTRSTKVLSAEVMGRHSNLIFWDRDSKKIIGASHVVTADMSRQREVAAGLAYARPPQQDKPSVFALTKEQFESAFNAFCASRENAPAAGDKEPASSWEHWLLSAFSGVGRHLADELIAAAGVDNEFSAGSCTAGSAEAVWAKIAEMQATANYRPAMRVDLTRYTVLSWWPELKNAETSAEWKKFPAVNDMVDEYFRTLQQREQLQQLRDRIRSELKAENERLESRLQAANKQLEIAQGMDQLKTFGDLILANISNIKPGQSELVCDNLYATEGNGKAHIALNPNLSASQNAQNYYRQFAKARMRSKAATVARGDAEARLAALQAHMANLEGAKSADDLARLKELVLDRGKRAEQKPPAAQPHRPPQKPGGSGKSPRLMTTKSSDGWTIFIGRNKYENDVLLSKLAHPADIWLHVQGQEGAHVLIKNPNKQDPPATTLREAAQLAARFSRISLGSKVRVVYTHCKHVKKIGGKDKPGLVRYENEKTIEVDTSAPMPPGLRKLFAK